MASANIQQLHPPADNARTFKPTLNWRSEELDAANSLLQLSNRWTSSSEVNSEAKAGDDELEPQLSRGRKRKAVDYAELSQKRNHFDYAVDNESDGEGDSISSG